jgi:hypothetical protein
VLYRKKAVHWVMIAVKETMKTAFGWFLARTEFLRIPDTTKSYGSTEMNSIGAITTKN